MKLPVTVDFETKGIEDRPTYPPEPVGVSIKLPHKAARYYAWGHPTANNCTKAQATAALTAAWGHPAGVLCHHAKFDIDVAETHMGMSPLPWDKVHDTMFLLFLNNPHSITLGLKPAAAELLDMPAAERDEVKDWVLANIKCKPSEWGAYIWMAPGDLVGRYANGDTERTEKLFELLYPIIVEAGMEPAYDRERKLLPIFLESERNGMRVDVAALRRDIPLYQKELARAEAWLYKKLGGELNIDSDKELADRLNDTGIVTEWAVTKTGKRSTAKKTMTADRFNDVTVYQVLGYRNRLTTCLRMFMEPWLAKAEASGGTIHPNWNQVRQIKSGSDTKGTRTGRPSCDNPNLLNVAKSYEDKGDGWTHPKCIKLLPLPLIRTYCLPEEGGVWLHRDYNQQELRLLGHFEDGAIMQAYIDNPTLDIHQFVKEEILRITGKDFPRTPVKTINFGRIYGEGANSLAEKLGLPIDVIKDLRAAQNVALPGLPELDKSIKALAKAGEPIITWGGRVYYVEPPKFSEKFGRNMTFEYKMLNYTIQGSAADCTKEAIIRWYYHPKRNPKATFIVTVYDEINISAPVKTAKKDMKLLQECMESIEVDVPLLTDGKSGTAWGHLKKEAA